MRHKSENSTPLEHSNCFSRNKNVYDGYISCSVVSYFWVNQKKQKKYFVCLKHSELVVQVRKNEEQRDGMKSDVLKQLFYKHTCSQHDSVNTRILTPQPNIHTKQSFI